jgi:dihydropteroate synthase
MGIVNVTPDSFSDGGRFINAPAAIEHGLGLLRQGADLVDVGGESTRPGAGRVAQDKELPRVVPVVRALGSAGAQVSIDTTRASVAAAAVDAGATLVNDVSGGLADPDMLPFLAGAGVPCVAVAGVWGVRVHNVPPAVAGARVAARLAAEWPGK